jgi:RNA ligase
MKYDLNILNEYIEKGLIIKQVHPTLPLSIYNYSRTCQYDRLWDKVTLNCRGLVLDNEGNVIAKPFPKFFNMEELSDSEIPKEAFEVFEKMDGSLGIFFYYETELALEERYNKWFNNNYETGMERFFDPNNLPDFDDPYYEPTPTTKGEWYMATRGSFTSEQAIKGLDIAKRNGLDKKCVPGFTYLFEIIYPENRIVVDYGNDERLVLLSIVNSEGNEIPYEEIQMDGWDIVNRYDGVNDYTKLKEVISNDAEGYVIRFRNGMRMKIKGDEYVRLHRILTNFSTTDIWELLRTKGNMDEFLERVPDEFDNWVKENVRDLIIRFENIEKDYAEIFSNLKNQNLDRKEFAIKALHYRHSSILFSMLDAKIYEDTIWKIIKPKWSKPFKKDLDN